jgi:cell division protein FtsW
MMNSKGYAYDLLCAVLLLAALGMVMVFSATQVIAKEQFGSPYYFIKHEIIHLALGGIILYLCMKLPYRIYRSVAVWGVIIGVLSLVSVLLWGIEVRGARRWLRIFNFTIQPVEFVKYALIIFIADITARSKGSVRRLKEDFLPVFLVSCVVAILLVLQPNISNATLIFGITFILLFLGGSRLAHLAVSYGALLLVAVPYLYFQPHVRNRVIGLLNSGEYLLSQNWHVRQSLISLGSGFIYGCGPGNGHQKYRFLPDAHTDFIYSIVGEELGFIGTALVLCIIMFIFYKALIIARNAPDLFSRYLALGIGLIIVLTSLVNIAMTTGLIPTVGLPLPFVSYGGTSLLTSMAAVGILLNISSAGHYKARRTDHSRAGRPVFASKRENRR